MQSRDLVFSCVHLCRLLGTCNYADLYIISYYDRKSLISISISDLSSKSVVKIKPKYPYTRISRLNMVIDCS